MSQGQHMRAEGTQTPPFDEKSGMCLEGLGGSHLRRLTNTKRAQGWGLQFESNQKIVLKPYYWMKITQGMTVDRKEMERLISRVFQHFAFGRRRSQ